MIDDKFPPGHPALRRAEAAGTFVGYLIVAAPIAVPICWYLALALPGLLWGR